MENQDDGGLCLGGPAPDEGIVVWKPHGLGIGLDFCMKKDFDRVPRHTVQKKSDEVGKAPVENGEMGFEFFSVWLEGERGTRRVESPGQLYWKAQMDAYSIQ